MGAVQSRLTSSVRSACPPCPAADSPSGTAAQVPRCKATGSSFLPGWFAISTPVVAAVTAVFGVAKNPFKALPAQ
jgi:hypothetical protein